MSFTSAPHPPLAAKPNPKSIFNLSTIPGGLGELLNKPNEPGVAAYTIPSPAAPTDAIYVEPAATPMRRRTRAVLGAAGIASITVGLTVVLAFAGSGTTWSDLLDALALSLGCGVLIAVFMLWVTEVFRRMSPWAIVIQPFGEDLVVRLAYRRAWATLDDLQPSISIGQLHLRYGNGSEVPSSKLPVELKGQSIGLWLRLEWSSRVRWVLLEVAKTEASAELAAVEWMERLGLKPDGYGAAHKPPARIGFYREQRLW